MRLSIRNALLIAGVTLLVSFVAAQFQNGKLLFATLLVLLAPVVLFLSFKKEKITLSCILKNPTSTKSMVVILSVVVLAFGFGFSLVKLIYLWL